jgi:hypothetical protein
MIQVVGSEQHETVHLGTHFELAGRAIREAFASPAIITSSEHDPIGRASTDGTAGVPSGRASIVAMPPR